jgi:hypothetical protein
MRFATTGGQVLDIFQADTQCADESWTTETYAGYQLLLDASLNQGKYTWVVANFHPGGWGTYAAQGEQILDFAVANGIPIWSGAQMNAFTRVRDATNFQNVQWAGNTLSFDINIPMSGPGNLTGMVPSVFNGNALEKMRMGGSDIPYTVQTIAGTAYAFFVFGAGGHVDAIYVPEPGMLALLLTGGLVAGGLAAIRRRRARF